MREGAQAISSMGQGTLDINSSIGVDAKININSNSNISVGLAYRDDVGAQREQHQQWTHGRASAQQHEVT